MQNHHDGCCKHADHPHEGCCKGEEHRHEGCNSEGHHHEHGCGIAMVAVAAGVVSVSSVTANYAW